MKSLISAIIISILLLFEGCSNCETVTRTETSQKDSASVSEKPQRVATPAKTDTLYKTDTIWVKPDSVKVPTIEHFESQDKKKTVTIDRTGKVPIAIFNQAKDSLDVMGKEANYWRWLSQQTTITQKDDGFFQGITLKDIMIFIGVLFGLALVINLIKK